jgi:hypothetical protein
MSMPDEKKYQELIATLTAMTKEFDAAGTDDDDDRKIRLKNGYAALRATILFLSGDEAVRKNGLVRPLALIAEGAHDMGRGANPKSFAFSPEGSKPTEITQEAVKANLAYALELLASKQMGKMGTGRAAQWVVEEIRRAKLTDSSGASATKDQVIQWRKDIASGRASSDALETWDGNCRYDSDFRRMPFSDIKLQKAKEKARTLIEMTASIAPYNAPKSARS